MYTWKLPCDRLGILSISSILPQILPQTSSQTQGVVGSGGDGGADGDGGASPAGRSSRWSSDGSARGVGGRAAPVSAGWLAATVSAPHCRHW